MPLYVYRCNTCSEVFEKMMRWSEADSHPVCPHCQGQDTQKKVSNFASFGSSSSGSFSTASSCAPGSRFS